MNNFGNHLKYLRNDRKASQEDVAKFANITKSTISKYERGVVEPTISIAKKIGSYFGVTIDQMMSPIDSHTDIKDLCYVYESAITVAHVKKISPSVLIELIDFAEKFNKK